MLLKNILPRYNHDCMPEPRKRNISWDLETDSMCQKLAREHDKDVSEFLTDLVRREWQDTTLPLPDPSPGFIKALGKLKELDRSLDHPPRPKGK